jgi:hypothetical protein
MMKRTILIIGLAFGVSSTKAQVLIPLLLGDKLNSGKVEFGLDGGMNFASIKGLNGVKSLRPFNLGFYFDIKMKNPSWMINTGVIVKSTMGADNVAVYSIGDAALDTVFKGGKVERRINYFNVPVLVKYRFDNNFYLKAGIQLGLRYNANDIFVNSKTAEEDLKYTLKIKDQFHPLDAGLAFGLGYRLMKGSGMNIGVQYYLGLVDIVIDDASPKQYNRSLYLTAGIPIGANKAKKKAEKQSEASTDTNY